MTTVEGKDEVLFTAGGRPRVVIFFLGKGCSHCMEQLNAFARSRSGSRRPGSTSPPSAPTLRRDLKETLAGEGEKKSPFPFPLYSDASLAAFKAFRAHDDFEEIPLHGTYLIDRGGRIRWQEIGFEPFMKPEWLLEECVRLLALREGES